MRVLVASFLVSMLTLGAAFGQAGLKVGAFALPQLVWLVNADDDALGDDQYQQELLGGMAGGLQLGYNLTDLLGVRLNLIYSQQGGRYTRLNAAGTRVNEVVRLEYVQLPLMVGFNSNPEFQKITFSAYGGIQLGVLAQAKEYDDNTEFELPLEQRVRTAPTLLQAYEDMDLSVVGDIGIDVRLDYDLVMNLHLRANYSLQDVENKDAFVLLDDAGTSRQESYWDFVRDMDERASTRGLNIGLLIGITYTFVNE